MEVNKQITLHELCLFEGHFATQDSKRYSSCNHEENANFYGTMSYQDQHYTGAFSGEFYTLTYRTYYACASYWHVHRYH